MSTDLTGLLVAASRGDRAAFDRAFELRYRELTALAHAQRRLVECRFFAGLTVPQTAEALGISSATVKRDWQLASAWLHRELGGRARLPAPA